MQWELIKCIWYFLSFYSSVSVCPYVHVNLDRFYLWDSKRKDFIEYCVVNSKVLQLGCQVSKYFKQRLLSTRNQVPQGSLGISVCPTGKKRSAGISDAVAVVQSLSHVQLSVIPWPVAHQVPLFFTISWSLLKFISTESVMLSNHLILHHPSPPALHISQHQGLFQWVGSSHQVANGLELQLQQ